MMHTEITPGIYRIEHAYTNFYIIEADDGLTVVDAGLPKGWSLLLDALQKLGRTPRDIKAFIITHAHFDHLGFAARAQAELDIPIYIHQSESYIARHPYRYDHENSRLPYPFRYPRSLPVIASLVRAGALRVPGLDAMQTFTDESTLNVPGKPEIITTVGHTYGHCAFYLPDRDVLFSGDALVTLNIYTGKTGPQIISGAATANSKQALDSLDALAATKATTLLPGHGEPWFDGVDQAVQAARDVGAS